MKEIEKIKVINLGGKNYKNRMKMVEMGWVEYIGRDFGGLKGSVLGNKFRIGKDGDRDEVIEKYKKWVWEEYKKGGEVKKELERLVEMYKKDGSLVLGCWCFPEKCHGDVLVSFIKWLVKE